MKITVEIDKASELIQTLAQHGDELDAQLAFLRQFSERCAEELCGQASEKPGEPTIYF